MKSAQRPLAVYLHIPFCERRCGYCDFLSCCELAQIDTYIQKLCAEIRAFDFRNYTVETIYFGGGTPSLLSPEQLQKILACLPPTAQEITIECNPNSLTMAKLAAYRALGINRISIGVQAFDNRTLTALGRLHDVKQAVTAIELAHQYFENVSIDLIKDIPEHPFVPPPTTVLNLVQHVSVYSLTKDDRCVMETDEPVVLPGFQRYEISNYARVGFTCRHNLVYWTGGEYIGFGAGAHSLIDNVRFCNSNDILHYQRLPGTPRTAATVRAEQIMLGLRLSSGFPKNLVTDQTALARLKQQGLVKINNDRVIATARGCCLLNQIWLQLV